MDIFWHIVPKIKFSKFGPDFFLDSEMRKNWKWPIFRGHVVMAAEVWTKTNTIFSCSSIHTDDNKKETWINDYTITHNEPLLF